MGNHMHWFLMYTYSDNMIILYEHIYIYNSVFITRTISNTVFYPAPCFGGAAYEEYKRIGTTIKMDKKK